MTDDKFDALEAKIDQINSTAVSVRIQLKRRTRTFLVASLIGVIAGSAAGFGIWRLNDIATENRDNGQITKENSVDIKHALQILIDATGPEAQDKQNKALSDTIADIKRSINCVGFYTLGKRPPACAATDSRMDEMDAGGDPFSH